MSNDLTTSVRGPIGIVRMERPDSLNALSGDFMSRLAAALRAHDEAPDVRCLLLAGQPRAFATGTDIAEVAEASAAELLTRDPLARWDEIAALRKPLVACVAGFALGSGFELALACDLIIAAESARFALPQTGLGIMPGAGGTQRLARRVGPAVTLDLVLTGRVLSAREALALGLVSRVVPVENCEAEALAVCEEIARRAPLAVRFAKEAVRRAAEMPLRAGLALERQAYYTLFATDDQKEGMRAFLERRPPVFVGR